MKCDNLWTLDGGAASFLFPSPRRAASSRIVSCERRRFPAGSDLKRSVSNLHTEWVDHEMPRRLKRKYERPRHGITWSAQCVSRYEIKSIPALPARHDI